LRGYELLHESCSYLYDARPGWHVTASPARPAWVYLEDVSSLGEAATLVNTVLGVVGAMILFRTIRPRSAIRSGLRLIGAHEHAG
jgi:hypothetical protein